MILKSHSEDTDSIGFETVYIDDVMSEVEKLWSEIKEYYKSNKGTDGFLKCYRDCLENSKKDREEEKSRLRKMIDDYHKCLDDVHESLEKEIERIHDIHDESCDIS